MKKMNKKGFLLAESIIVGVFVLSLFTFLFVNVVPLVGQYEAREKYDTITGVYNAHLVRTMILEDTKAESILELNDLPYKYYEREDLCSNDNIEKVNYCTKLLGDSYLNVDKIYITWYRTETIKKFSKNNDFDFDRATRDYIDSLDGFKQPSGSTYDNYKRIIVYYNDGTFANIEVKVAEGGEDGGSGTPGPGSNAGEELGCIITAQPTGGTKKGTNNWFIGDVSLYLSTSGSVIEFGLATTDTPETPIYNSITTLQHTEDTNGIYYYGYVKDIDGFEETCSVFIKKDTTSPQIDSNPTAPSPEIYNPTGGNPVSDPFSLTVNATDPESGIDYWYYSFDEETWTKYDDPSYDSYEKEEYITSPFSQERNEDVYIKVCNKAGLCGTNSTRINIDKTPPGCTLTDSGDSKKNGYYTSDVIFTLMPDSGITKYLISSTQQDRTKLTASSFGTTLTKTMNTDSNGTHYYGYVMDSAGNIGECVSPEVKRDTTAPPQPTITNPSGGNWRNTPFSLTVSSTDTNSGNDYWYYKYADIEWVKYNESGYNSYEQTTFTTSPFSTERNENVYIQVCDKAGNCSASASTKIAIDKTSPTCSFTPSSAKADSGWYVDDLDLTISYDDVGDIQSEVAEYNISTNSATSYSGVSSAKSIADTSSQMYYCYVKDAAGNEGKNSHEVKKDTEPPYYSYNNNFGNFNNFIAYDSSGSVKTSWVQSYSCGSSGCEIYACSYSGATSYSFDNSGIYNSGIFKDDTSGFNYVTRTEAAGTGRCTSWPCTRTAYYRAYDNAGNYKSYYLKWIVDYQGRSGTTCNYETGIA